MANSWQQSGLSAPKFAKAEGIGLHVLRYWIQTQRASPQPSGSKSPDFVVVSAPASSIEPTARALEAASTENTSGVFELRVNGMVVSVPLVAGHGAFIETVHAVLCEVGQ